jgi:hypothetical protein
VNSINSSERSEMEVQPQPYQMLSQPMLLDLKKFKKKFQQNGSSVKIQHSGSSSKPKQSGVKPKTSPPAVLADGISYGCYVCGSADHWTKYCPKRWTPNKDSEANIVATTSISKKKTNNTSLLTGNEETFITTSSIWAVDTGATSHMCCEKKFFTSINTSNASKVQGCGKHTYPVEGIGKVECIVKTQTGETYHLQISDVLYIPTLRKNLISVSTAHRKGHGIQFVKEPHINILNEGETIIPLIESDGLYLLHTYSLDEVHTVTTNSVSLETWHKRFGHANIKLLKSLPNSVEGMTISNSKHIPDECESCLTSKMTKTPFHNSIHKTTRVLELVHTDVAGPIQVPKMEGDIYAAIFIDDFSHIMIVYTMKTKSQTLEKFQLCRDRKA